ncbi:MAG TPA: 3-deoxy-7-phosphoheptulonate synthase [Herpetosiphonaceae bacterium]
MVIIMSATADRAARSAVLERLAEHRLRGHVWEGGARAMIAAVGGKIPAQLGEQIQAMGGVSEVVPTRQPYTLAGREFRPEATVVRVGSVEIGGGQPVVMAGPCSVESESQLLSTARAVAEAGAHILRGGAFKPRTSPYAFRGLGEEGLKLLALAREATGLPIVTEALSTRDVDLVARYADLIQIGARNMQNFALLEEAGQTGRPVMIKRGPSATVEEWLLAAEYVLATGNRQVILCERGIRTFETATRNTLDLNAVAVAKRRSHLPVIADPSHGTGKWYLVRPLALAGLAAGADGLMIEVHHDPDRATSDGPQSLTHGHFAELMEQVRLLAGLRFETEPAAALA